MSVRSEKIGCQVFACPAGIVHIHLSNVTIHLNKPDFLEFTELLQKMAGQILPEAARILTFKRPN